MTILQALPLKLALPVAVLSFSTQVSDFAYQESRRAASDTFLPRYICDDIARAHVLHFYDSAPSGQR